ncbi:MAG: efflux RND transporter periplasmic adaptor subunit [Betaproteobacteria bacterium]|nr:efflux RND transporter periplasmic adaptor subunit [Betaproteobacteria bacterium]
MSASPTPSPAGRRRFPALVIVAFLVLAALGAWWLARDKSPQAAAKTGPAAVPVTAAVVEKRDVPVTLRVNGSVVAIQSVDLRAQVTSTVREVHIREGQNVNKGDLLVSLDSRADEANVKKAEAQVQKDLADLANAKRTLERQKQLFAQKFIAQSALDAAENQVASLEGQLAVDRAAAESAKVSLAYTQIRASFAGRTGAIGVRPGSVVQPNGAVLVTVTQIDPIQVAFTLPEKELPGLARAIAAGPVEASITVDDDARQLKGRVNFVDNAVDTTTGTIRAKAQFENRDARLWPGMYVSVALSPRTLEGASVVPVQAVQTGPDSRFVYVIGEERKVSAKPVVVAHIDRGFAAITGVDPGARVVVEGAQNLRPGSLVSVGDGRGGEGKAGKSGKGKGADGGAPPVDGKTKAP